jgi:hypothetical protein
MKLNEQYTAEIYDHLLELFDRDSENFKFDLEKIDATELFTALVKANGILFNRLTDDNKSFLDFTYLCNSLIVQAMKNKEEE